MPLGRVWGDHLRDSHRPDASVTDPRYKAIFDRSPDGILLVDGDGVIQQANARALEMFGYAEAGLAGVRVEALIPREARAAHVGQRESYQRGPAVRPMGIGLELRALGADGLEFPVEVSLAPVEGEGGARWTVATVRDVSARRRLQDFSAGALRASEDERARIARELHDDTAQRLATVLVRLRLLADKVADPDARAACAEIRDAIADTAEGVRRIARGLRPPELQDAGLGSALRSHVRRLEEDGPLDIDLELTAVDRIQDLDTALITYRIVQESLSNVVRHSRSPRVRVRVGVHEQEVQGVVQDEGVGFRTEHDLVHGRGLGLIGMQERATMLGGRVWVESCPGEGTTVRFRLPLERAEVGAHG